MPNFRHNCFQNNEKEKTLWDCFFGGLVVMVVVVVVNRKDN
jgi:hypothetical protein